jgi:FkbM family methyltransferase
LSSAIPRRTTTIRSGLGQGLRHRGGLGVRSLIERRPPDAEERLLRGLDLAGRVVYDIGACEGIHTLFFATRAGRRGEVVTFEPHPRNYERALTNVQLNNLGNVTILPVGVGREPGTITFHYDENDTGQMTADPDLADALKQRANGSMRTLDVAVTSVDAAIEDRGLPAPDFVKIDVEGLELDVLEGMRQTLETKRPMLFVELHGAGDTRKEENARRVTSLLLEDIYEVVHVESGTPVPAPEATPTTGHLFARPRAKA